MNKRRIAQEAYVPPWYQGPSWAMMTFTLTTTALILAILSSARQNEMARKCRILPE